MCSIMEEPVPKVVLIIPFQWHPCPKRRRGISQNAQNRHRAAQNALKVRSAVACVAVPHFRQIGNRYAKQLAKVLCSTQFPQVKSWVREALE